MLGGELLRAKPESCHDLGGEHSGVLETVRVKSNLSDHCIVGYHHCHGTEKCLQIVRELCPSRVAWIHSNENVASLSQGDHAILKKESLLL